VLVADDGHAQSCRYESSLQPNAKQDCSVASGTAAQATHAGAKDQFTRITFERRFTPGAKPEMQLQPGETLLGGRLMSLAIDAKGAVEKVEYAGTATVEGDKVDKYHVTVDSGSIAGALGAGAGADLPKSVTYDLYVDANHLVRRIEIDVAKQQITMTVSRWGEPVDIEVPPASQIAP